MKTYAVSNKRKASQDKGECTKCHTQIKAGDIYHFAHPAGGRVFFCGKCEIDFSLVGKNTLPEKVAKTETEIQAEVDKVIAEAEAIAKTEATEVKTEVEKPTEVKKTVKSKKQAKTSKKDKTTEVKPEASEVKAVYCTKCSGMHTINSRRYNQHKLYLESK